MHLYGFPSPLKRILLISLGVTGSACLNCGGSRFGRWGGRGSGEHTDGWCIVAKQLFFFSLLLWLDDDDLPTK